MKQGSIPTFNEEEEKEKEEEGMKEEVGTEWLGEKLSPESERRRSSGQQ